MSLPVCLGYPGAACVRATCVVSTVVTHWPQRTVFDFVVTLTLVQGLLVVDLNVLAFDLVNLNVQSDSNVQVQIWYCGSNVA